MDYILFWPWTQEKKQKLTCRKPYFIWTIFFSNNICTIKKSEGKVVNLILYGLYSFQKDSLDIKERHLES